MIVFFMPLRLVASQPISSYCYYQAVCGLWVGMRPKKQSMCVFPFGFTDVLTGMCVCVCVVPPGNGHRGGRERHSGPEHEEAH